MPATLKLHADEGGTYTVCIACKNDAGGADDPLTLFWRLTDSNGTVINSRSEKEITDPGASENVKLVGDPIRGRSKFIIDNYVAFPIPIL